MPYDFVTLKNSGRSPSPLLIFPKSLWGVGEGRGWGFQSFVNSVEERVAEITYTNRSNAHPRIYGLTYNLGSPWLAVSARLGLPQSIRKFRIRKRAKGLITSGHL